MDEAVCPRCGSTDIVVVARVPWSTDGLMPEQQLYVQCERCGRRRRLHHGRVE